MEKYLMTNTVVISIMSKDRMGIIARVSQKVAEVQGNIADIRQSVLCGYFTMILLVDFPNDVSLDSISARLDEINTPVEPHLAIAVKPVIETKLIPSNTYPADTYVLTVTGPDQIGFVAAIANFCLEHHINILDLSTTRKEDQYVMILFIDITAAPAMVDIREDMAKLSEQTGFEISLQHLDLFRAVNEIHLPVN
jgi:glycine cleavage system transcriptional repressor